MYVLFFSPLFLQARGSCVVLWQCRAQVWRLQAAPDLGKCCLALRAAIRAAPPGSNGPSAFQHSSVPLGCPGAVPRCIWPWFQFPFPLSFSPFFPARPFSCLGSAVHSSLVCFETAQICLDGVGWIFLQLCEVFWGGTMGRAPCAPSPYGAELLSSSGLCRCWCKIPLCYWCLLAIRMHFPGQALVHVRSVSQPVNPF